MGASVPETGSHPTGQAELHRLDASRFDPARKFTPGPWIATYFTKPDGSEIETVDDVAETVAFSAQQSDRAKLHGVTLTGKDDGVVVCYTGNGPASDANARLIAAAPDLLAAAEAQERLWEYVGDEAHKQIKIVQQMRRAALAKARGQ